MAVDAHRALGGVIEARHELGERRLAGAGLSDQRHGLTGGDRQVDVAQRPRVGVVGAVAERDLVEAHLAADLVQRDGAGRVDQLGLLVEQREDLVQSRHPGLVGGVELGELLDGVEEVVERGDEGEHHAGRRVAVDRLDAADEQDLHRDQRRQQLDAREVGRVELDRRPVGSAVLVVECFELGDVAPLLAEGADDPDARQRLLQVAGDGRDLLPRQPVGVGGGDAEGQRAEAEDGQGDEGQQGQVEVQDEQDDHDPQQGQARLDERGQAVLDELVERLDVVGHPADEHAGAIARVEAHRQRLQVGEQLEPQVLERALTHPADEVGLGVGGDAVDDRGDEEDDHDPVKRRRVVAADALVDGQLGQRGGGQCRRGGRDQRDEHRHHPPPIRSQDLGQPAQLATAPAGLLQASAQLGAAGGDGAHRPATSDSIGLRVRKTWSGSPFSTISRYRSDCLSSSS